MSLQKYTIVCFLAAFTVLAHLTHALAQSRSLGEVMGLMGRSLGAIARPVTQGSAGPQEAALARQLKVLVEEAHGILPDSVLALPAQEQEPRIQRYQQLMGELAQAAGALAAAIEASDAAKARAAMQTIMQLRNTGHQEFRL